MNTPKSSMPFPDRRRVRRSAMTRAGGVLSVSGVEQACRVRDMSPIGVGLAAADLPLPGQRVWIETQGLARSPAVVVWRDPARCGLRLEDGERARANDDAARGAPGPRTQRFFVRTRADLENNDTALHGEVIDISAEGMRMSGAGALQSGLLELGSRWTITLDGLRETLLGRIRWTSDSLTGIRFDRAIPRDDLFTLLCCRG